MAINIKPITQIVTKWQTNAGAATNSYTAGVRAPKQDWATQTSAAAGSWQTGVQQAAADGRFADGVVRAGTPKWQTNSLNVGAPRYAGGIQNGVAAYNAGITPFIQALSQLTLPARLPTGDPGNIARVQAVDTLMSQTKRSLA